MKHHQTITPEFIRENNLRLLAGVEIRHRYVFGDEVVADSVDDSPGDMSQVAVDNDMKTFIVNVFPAQYRATLTQVYRKAGFSAGKGNRVAERCVKSNLIKIIKSRFGRGNPRYPILLPLAYEVLGIDELQFRGKGGYEHRLYLHLIEDRFSVYSAVIEFERGGKAADVGVETNEGLFLIEVEMSKSPHIRDNIVLDHEKCRASYLVVCAIDDGVLEAVRDTISQCPATIKEKTEGVLVKEILSQPASVFVGKIQQ